nr:RNA polymerase sigma factor region1.1 domain-containing protein [Methylomarinum sp. Ch1-1]MDP4522466.1 RNA polymerase sigma factor region1.1 domain-containing protein [Methylomarinum sp. Ch1-1]
MNQEQQQSQLKQLIAKGKQQGYLTYAEVNDHLPSDIVDPDQIEDIIGMINDMGIQVHEVAPDDDDSLIGADAAVSTDDDDEDVEEVAALASVDSEFGRTTDPVRMYMREMGSVELLTREEELKIAKRIEYGQQQIIEGLSRSGFIVDSFLQSFDAVLEEDSGVRLTDMMSGFADLSEPEELDASADEAEESDNNKALDYDEVKEKVDVLRSVQQKILESIRKNGYEHDKTEQLFTEMAQCFAEFKWTPQYLKKMANAASHVTAQIREKEKTILNICVKKARMPKKTSSIRLLKTKRVRHG